MHLAEVWRWAKSLDLGVHKSGSDIISFSHKYLALPVCFRHPRAISIPLPGLSSLRATHNLLITTKLTLNTSAREGSRVTSTFIAMNLRPFQLFTGLLLLVSFHPIAVEGRPSDSKLVPRAIQADDPSLPAALDSICPGGLNATTVESSEPLGTGGVVITKGFCNAPETSSEDDIVPRVVARQASCPTAPNNCVSRFGTMYQGNGWVSKCGAPCTTFCYSGTGGPDPNHCDFIFNSMRVESPALFTLNPNQFILATYQSCGTGIQNQIASSSVGCSQKMIYDWPDWADIGHYIAWNCQAAQNARGGQCLGDTGLYQSGTHDFYVQVYAN
ncbi:hypothetical protein CPB86DRAFT_873592 [Serendipita vermifera]|nr:hypothetical protein CPB86DRAFT_873592 [Serendipita vermifera]